MMLIAESQLIQLVQWLSFPKVDQQRLGCYLVPALTQRNCWKFLSKCVIKKKKRNNKKERKRKKLLPSFRKSPQYCHVVNSIRGHSFIAYAKSSKALTFLNPCAYQGIRNAVFFRKILHMYETNDFLSSLSMINKYD